jgi:8-oxo-dGTP diphosphatase
LAEIRLGCAVLAVRDGRILLGKRGKAPFYGKWVIPGGGVNRFESLAETAVREIAEETGLEIAVREIATVKEVISPPNEHRVIVYVSADVVGGVERAGSDILEVGFFAREQLAEMAEANQLTPTVEATLREQGWLSRVSKQSGLAA